MAENKRLNIGIIFNFNPVWMGGVIYIQNLVNILNWLDDDEMPEITVFYNPDLIKYVDTLKYPYLNLIKWNFPPIIKGNVYSWMKGKNLFIDKIIAEHQYLHAIFPVMDVPVRTRTNVKVFSWYADLQHKYYPGFFSWRKRLERDLRIRLMLHNTDGLILSSNAVLNDFNKFFKVRKSLKVHVFHFCSVLDSFHNADFNAVRLEYNVPEEYFMVSNQFHQHKNHAVILTALARLKQAGVNIHIVMTGRFPDASSSAYMKKIHNIIDENDLMPQISLLGLVPREKQLILMKHAKAIIQPSLFEGWSTVIEDAISLQTPVIASSLPVNKEQLGDLGNFFDPFDSERLAEIMRNFPKRDINKKIYEDYDKRVKKAAKAFVNIFKSNMSVLKK